MCKMLFVIFNDLRARKITQNGPESISNKLKFQKFLKGVLHNSLPLATIEFLSFMSLHKIYSAPHQYRVLSDIKRLMSSLYV